MICRSRLDLGWKDLAFGAFACIRPWNRQRLEGEVRQGTEATARAYVGLSVRSGFDALLEALAFPEGSEILVSAITIPDMARIIRAHGLVPVPVDVDAATLEPIPEALEEAFSSRSRALLVAHLFGAQLRLDESLRFAREKGILLMEDCAQSFAPGSFMGNPESDVRMVSFGPIKTDTALGGGILLVRDATVLGRMETVQARWPLQTRWEYARRVLKYALLHLTTWPPLFGLLRVVLHLLGRSHDEMISRVTRGFGEGGLLPKIRKRPSAPQLAMLRRRLAEPGVGHLRARVRVGRAFAEALPGGLRWPGNEAPVHTHWLFPVLVRHPEGLMHLLWAQGFDATRGTSSLGVVEAVPERPEIQPINAREVLARLLFLPVYPEVPKRELERMRACLSEGAGDMR